MRNTGTIEVRPQNHAWAIFLTSPAWTSWNPLGSYRRKAHAVIAARALGRFLARGTFQSVELVIKDRRGRIRQKDTYGYDPEKSRG